MANTIVAGNQVTDTRGPSKKGPDVQGTINSLGYNLIDSPRGSSGKP